MDICIKKNSADWGGRKKTNA